ncbi:hypothetical protein FraEuI1c_2001 [Pseudofrankia inefficax]|uniref:Uncharacterized protein n=1 Tax=Pseudofrankia inefficax (strain DSM 45817 / CECT 9037 / DDB 130130 / EuI1c) TaxID=298654 RepID=E3IV31_PSEI1|nr:hypothetical protein FraEuI1c_2001 [Pseudofrankia inefficax]
MVGRPAAGAAATVGTAGRPGPERVTVPLPAGLAAFPVDPPARATVVCGPVPPRSLRIPVRS